MHFMIYVYTFDRLLIGYRFMITECETREITAKSKGILTVRF